MMPVRGASSFRLDIFVKKILNFLLKVPHQPKESETKKAVELIQSWQYCVEKIIHLFKCTRQTGWSSPNTYTIISLLHIFSLWTLSPNIEENRKQSFFKFRGRWLRLKGWLFFFFVNSFLQNFSLNLWLKFPWKFCNFRPSLGEAQT